MPEVSTFAIVCLVAFGILFTSSAAIYLLLALKPGNETFQKVKKIIHSWWVIIGTVLLSFAFGKWGILSLFFLLSIFLVREYMAVSRVNIKKEMNLILFFLTAGQYAMLSFEQFRGFQIWIPMMSLWIIPGLIIFRALIQNMDLIFSVAFGLSMTIFYLSHLPALYVFHNKLGFSENQTLYAMMTLLLLTWGNDVFQFLSGKMFGRLKIVPQVSPNKTLAGFIGGILCSGAISVLIFPMFLGLKTEQSLLIGVVLSVTGMFGDLFFSAVKRNMGTKDFSDLLPGHGGILDRIDSLIFTAPIFFHLILLMKEGL